MNRRYAVYAKPQTLAPRLSRLRTILIRGVEILGEYEGETA
jgi:hypothetical protein